MYFLAQVGWFSTGDEINATSAVIHAFYCKKDASPLPKMFRAPDKDLGFRALGLSLKVQVLGLKF